jgi:hypothetical protein
MDTFMHLRVHAFQELIDAKAERRLTRKCLEQSTCAGRGRGLDWRPGRSCMRGTEGAMIPNSKVLHPLIVSINARREVLYAIFES